MELGKRIKELRTAKGISQWALADTLKVGRGCITKWETDAHQPSLEDLVKLAKFFNVSTDYLLGMKDY